MLSCWKLLFAGLVGFSSSFALAEITFDKGGMPRCVSNASGGNLLLLWNEKDLYSRDIYILDTATYKPDLRFPKVYNCKNIPTDFSTVPVSLLQILSPGENKFAGYDLSSERLQKGLSQVRLGGSVFREEADAKSFLKKNPVPSFNRSINRKLTVLYGVGFVSDIYTELIANEPNNKKFMDLVLANLKSAPSEFKIFVKNHKVIYVKGLYRELKYAKNYDVLVNNLRAAGMDVVEVKTDSSNKIADNAAIVKNALDGELKKGQNIVLIGLSKGGTEALLGLSMLTAKLEGLKKPAGYGKVEAYLSLSGIFEGSFFVDFSGKFPWRVKLGTTLKEQYQSEGLTPPPLDRLLDLQTSPIAAAMAEIARNRLPQETIYFNAIGAIGGDGLATPGSFVRKLQDTVMRALMENYGANDGYVEYPGTALPKNLVKKHYAITVSGTHTLVDGVFHGVHMNDPKQSLVTAISLSVFKIISQNK